MFKYLRGMLPVAAAATFIVGSAFSVSAATLLGDTITLEDTSGFTPIATSNTFVVDGGVELVGNGSSATSTDLADVLFAGEFIDFGDNTMSFSVVDLFNFDGVVTGIDGPLTGVSVTFFDGFSASDSFTATLLSDSSFSFSIRVGMESFRTDGETTPATGLITLRFADDTGGTGGGGGDDVPAVPLPAGGWLMLAALGSFGAFRRLGRKSS